MDGKTVRMWTRKHINQVTLPRVITDPLRAAQLTTVVYPLRCSSCLCFGGGSGLDQLERFLDEYRERVQEGPTPSPFGRLKFQLYEALITNAAFIAC